MEKKYEKDLEIFRGFLKEKKFVALRAMAQDMNESDLAGILEEMEDEDMLRIFRLFPKELAADVFSQLEDDSQQYIITQLSDHEAGVVIDNMYADDATDLLEEMPANVVKRILAHTSDETRKDVNHLLQYPEDSAGSIMTVEFVDLKASMTIEDAIHRIRQLGKDSETVNVCYVLDDKRKLIGTVALRYLILRNKNEMIGDIMHEDVVSCTTSDDQEDVALIFKKYDFTALPVVDKENRMVGIITVDDIMDILEEETTEDIDKMNAIIPGDKPYLKTSVFETWKKRVPWLLLLMISATFTAGIITSFENALSKLVVLTAYIPMLMDTGGNAGSQSSAEVVRGLSLDEITLKDFPKVVLKELLVGIACGVTLAIAVFFKSIFFDQIGVYVALVVSLTVICTVFFSKLIASILVLVVDKIGFDPAVVASPVLTTIIDALSLMIYFTIATSLLHI
jgi:magnesium transporter